jgi:hypothetical protein
MEMYSLDSIVVSGCHRILYKDKWIHVHECRDAERIPDTDYTEPFLYCLNTDSKTIGILNHVFCDWDEIFEKELNRLSVEKNKIHVRFDRGFTKNTLVELQTGDKREIKDIDVGDMLKEGITVYGIVVMDGRDIQPFSRSLEKETDSLLYHLLTKEGYFYIEDVLYKDYNDCIEQFLK